MKKLLAFLLALTMCLSLCACGDSKTVETEDGVIFETFDEEIVVFDNDDYKLVITGKYWDDDNIGYTLEFEDYPDEYGLKRSIMVDKGSIDGYTCQVMEDGLSQTGSGTFPFVCLDGNKTRGIIYFYADDCGLTSLDDLKNVQFTITMLSSYGNSNTWGHGESREVNID